MNRLLFLLLFLCDLCNPPEATTAAFAQSWVVAKTAGSHKGSSDYIKEYDLTPSISTNIPNSRAYSSSAARLFLRLRERMVLRAHASATYGGRIVADYDVHAVGAMDISAMTDKEAFLVCQTNQIELKVGYYRGRVYYGMAAPPSDEWVTVFSSADRQRIVVVPDSGSMFVSDSSGASWKSIDRPGEYECTLSTTPKGSVMVAVVTVGPILTSTKPVTAQGMATSNWYSVASAADGSRLVLAGGPTQSAPALELTSSGSNVVVSWPASFTGYILQASSDLTAANWEDVTNVVRITDTQNEVTLPASNGKGFFRLRAR